VLAVLPRDAHLEVAVALLPTLHRSVPPSARQRLPQATCCQLCSGIVPQLLEASEASTWSSSQRALAAAPWNLSDCRRHVKQGARLAWDSHITEVPQAEQGQL
jgi:hypothetical protein